jgi:hypothetical protein
VAQYQAQVEMAGSDTKAPEFAGDELAVAV